MLLVTRTHHAVVYEIPTAAAPENAMANSRKLRVSEGLSGGVINEQSDRFQHHLQIACQIFCSPIFNQQREDCKYRDAQQIVVEH